MMKKKIVEYYIGALPHWKHQGEMAKAVTGSAVKAGTSGVPLMGTNRAGRGRGGKTMRGKAAGKMQRTQKFFLV